MPVKGSWDVTEQAMENQGGGTFLRLENDGDKAVGAFCGPPFVRERTFNEKTNAYEEWNAAAQAAGRKKQTRYAMNFYATSLKGKPLNEMRVLDMNFQTMTTVIGLRDKYGVGRYLFEVTRHGAKNDTKTTYQILPDKEITPELAALFGTPVPNDRNAWNEGSIPLIDLEQATASDEGDAGVTDDVKRAAKEAKPKEAKPTAAAAAAPTATPANGTNGHAAPAPATSPAAGSATPTPTPAAANAPLLSKEAVAVIIAKLKPLDREKGVDLFLAKFPYAKKVSEVRASDEVAAIALANQLASPPAVEDPFA